MATFVKHNNGSNNRLHVEVFVNQNMSHDMTKTTKWLERPVKTQISLGIRPVWSGSSLSAWRNIGSLGTHFVHSEDWSVWSASSLSAWRNIGSLGTHCEHSEDSDQSGIRPVWSESSLSALILLVFYNIHQLQSLRISVLSLFYACAE